MYITQAPNDLVALDAETGRTFWIYSYAPSDDARPCCGRVNRGVAILGDTLFIATLDSHLVAVDATNGHPIWNVEVASAKRGLGTLYGAGTGSGVATDSNGNVFALTNSAMRSQEVVLWGSGVGGDSANDDRTYPQKHDNLTNIPMEVFVGGISANVVYRGRSQYPGVDQINIMIPANVTPGCYVSVVAQSGSVVSNVVTLPINRWSVFGFWIGLGRESARGAGTGQRARERWSYGRRATRRPRASRDSSN